MKIISKIFKMIGFTVVTIIFLVLIITVLFMNLSPQFGRAASSMQKTEYKKTGNYKNGKFLNQINTKMDLNYWRLLKKMVEKAPNRQPTKNIVVEKIDSLDIVNNLTKTTRLTWFGHSTFLLEIDGKIILLDPMFGEHSSPHPWLGPHRFSSQLPIEIEKLPFIDAVIFSHDHYDHLDFGSIQKLKGKVGQFYTPLGVGNHLASWGVPENIIHQLKWWDEIKLEHIKLVLTPARHFSGRGFLDRSSTLWGSWVIKGKNESIYFSGDSGYGPHFKEIGEKYGPFDISLMECGQYNEDWQAIHMMPEETVQAAIDLHSKMMIPIHWGAFMLAFHDWKDPAERVTKEASKLNMPIATPKIGEVLVVGDSIYPKEKWWTSY